MGTLYLVATPIGNLADITLRAIDTLNNVNLIVAEDTRRTGVLLKKHGIDNKLDSYHEHNTEKMIPRLLSTLSKGDVALVSDAGTPALNDPGYKLVVAAIDAGYLVSPIPGASSPIAALVASGLPTDSFLYLGYIPKKKGDRTHLLESVCHQPYTLVMLETPHRLLKSLEDVLIVLGDRQITIAREMTKMHEEFFRGSVKEAMDYFSLSGPKGEITLVLAGASKADLIWSEDEVLSRAKELLDEGISASECAKLVAVESGWKRKEVYKVILRLGDQ